MGVNDWDSRYYVTYCLVQFLSYSFLSATLNMFFEWFVHVLSRLIEPRAIVFECGPNCGCGPGCVNRTSQRGLKYRLEVVAK